MTRLTVLLAVVLCGAACDNKADAEESKPALTPEEQAAEDVLAIARATTEYYKRTGKCIGNVRTTPQESKSCRGGCPPETWGEGDWAELGWKPDGPRVTHFEIQVQYSGTDSSGAAYCEQYAIAHMDADGDKRFRSFSSMASMDKSGVSVLEDLVVDGVD